MKREHVNDNQLIGSVDLRTARFIAAGFSFFPFYYGRQLLSRERELAGRSSQKEPSCLESAGASR
jgi:hypothetical protein